jgi:hypothetical protein
MSLFDHIISNNTGKQNAHDSIIGAPDLLLKKPMPKSIIVEETPSMKCSSLSQLLFIRNLQNPLSFFIYLDNTSFIGVLTHEQIYNIKIYNDLYKIYINNIFSVNIVEIEIINTSIDKSINLVIVKTTKCDLLNSKPRVELLAPVDFMNCEDPTNNYICENKNGDSISLTVEKITSDTIIIISHEHLLPGYPLYSNNKLVGIFCKKKDDKLYFYRISYYLSLILPFCSYLNRQLNNTIPKNIIYNQEQLYSIISGLNNKVNALEKRLESREIVKYPFQELIEKNNLRNEQNVGQLLNTIGELQNRLNTQDVKFNYMFENFKKMGF